MIKSIEKVTSIYESWTPSDIAFIKGLELSMGNLIILFYSQLRNEVVGWPDMNSSFFELSLTFFNVSDLKIELNNPKMHQISGFDILDISDNGLENVNYRIEDYENGTMSFFCEDIVVDETSEVCKLTM